MKIFRFIYAILFVLIILKGEIVLAQTVEFTKPDYADWTLEEYQDRITDNVWITRADIQSIFNIAQEESYSGTNGSPIGTLWANGTTVQSDSSSYTNFVAMHAGSPQSLIGDTISLYLTQDHLYFDVVFTSYSGGNSGGGFSYSRTSVNTMNLEEQQLPENFILSNNFPNPFNPITTFTYSLSVGTPVSLNVYDLNGKLVLEYNEGIKSPGRHKIIVNGSELSSGPYFCVFSIGSFKMIKKILLLK